MNVPPVPADEVTGLLEKWRLGSREAFDRLLPLVDAELRRVARGRMGRLRRELQANGLSGSLETTGLINEAYLRLVGDRRDWKSRAHFIAIAAHRMRNVCSDYARRVHAAKRQGGRRIELARADEMARVERVHPVDLVALTIALERLEEIDTRQSKVVELKFFGGLTDDEAAFVIGTSEATVKRDWRVARAWLYRELSGGTAG